MLRFKNILCVIEHGGSGRPALDRAVALAENNQAALTVVTVAGHGPAPGQLSGAGIDLGNLKAKLTDAQTQWLEAQVNPFRSRVEINSRVLHGTPFLQIIREVLRNQHDLVIKCPESPEWLDRFLAGDDMHLLRKCPCPVWMVKPGAKADETYRRILAAIDVDDNYPPAELATRQALNETVMAIAGALAVSEFAALHVVHAWEAVGEGAMRHGVFMNQPEEKVDAYVEQVRARHARRLDEFMHKAGASLGPDAMDYLKPELHLLKGPARKEIPALARRLRIDCLVMGTVARTGIRGFIVGNTAETILTQIDCSVLAIKPPGFITPVTLED